MPLIRCQLCKPPSTMRVPAYHEISTTRGSARSTFVNMRGKPSDTPNGKMVFPFGVLSSCARYSLQQLLFLHATLPLTLRHARFFGHVSAAFVRPRRQQPRSLFLVVCSFSEGMPSCTAIFCTRRLDRPESLATLLRYYRRARYSVPKVLFVFDRSTVVHHEGSSGMTIFRLGYHRHTPS